MKYAAAVFFLAASAVYARASEPYWLKNYSLPPYTEIRTATLAVKSMDQLGKIVAAIEMNGGALTAPLEAFAESIDSKQLSFTLDKAKAKEVEKALKKLGKLDAPAGKPHGAPLPTEEIAAKLEKLRAERVKNGAALAGAPVAAEGLLELVSRYSALEGQAKTAEGRALWNLSVKKP